MIKKFQLWSKETHHDPVHLVRALIAQLLLLVLLRRPALTISKAMSNFCMKTSLKRWQAQL
jgi:hypothetical protein